MLVLAIPKGKEGLGAFDHGENSALHPPLPTITQLPHPSRKFAWITANCFSSGKEPHKKIASSTGRGKTKQQEISGVLCPRSSAVIRSEEKT
jgi:hypothetical protein